jgi:beta-glucosidase
MAGRTYRFFQGQPLYPFGYGLSYSTFRYSAPMVDQSRVAVRVTNTSPRDGDEVVQLYRHRRLAGFQRVHVPAGKTVIVEFPHFSPAASNPSRPKGSGGAPPPH